MLTSEFEDKRELPSPSPYMHHCLYQQSGYWRRLLQPVVTAKALFNMRLSGFHFEDTWKSPMLTRHAYPRQARVKTFCTWGEGRDFSKVQCAREIKKLTSKAAQKPYPLGSHILMSPTTGTADRNPVYTRMPTLERTANLQLNLY